MTSKDHQVTLEYDKVIVGAGIFGLYAAKLCASRGERVLILEYDNAPFKRASFINQARVHNGYHYPRSYATAKKSAYYFDRFVNDFEFAIAKNFRKIYATAKCFSYTNAAQFSDFCNNANIPCEPVRSNLYFKDGLCDGAFEATEYSFDAKLISQHLLNALLKYSNVTVKFSTRIVNIARTQNGNTPHHLHTLNHNNDDMSNESHQSCCHKWLITTKDNAIITPYIINATYASLNQLLLLAKLKPLDIKYELCEVALCTVSSNIKNVGITIMDGPFFSLMPFGKSQYHSLTTVSNTPHLSTTNTLPEFPCQRLHDSCGAYTLANCNSCSFAPKTAFKKMYQLARHYLRDDIEITHCQSLFSIKAVLNTTEVDDSRPTVINTSSQTPMFLSVFSGKINTIYDLDEILSV